MNRERQQESREVRREIKQIPEDEEILMSNSEYKGSDQGQLENGINLTQPGKVHFGNLKAKAKSK